MPGDLDTYNFQAADTLLRMGGVFLLLFCLFIISKINLPAFPYSPDQMKKFINATVNSRSSTK